MKIRALFASVALVLPLVVSSSALAKRGYGKAGCGLGSVVMGASGGQIFAATTNNTLSSQYFGISFEMSNCLPDNKAASLERQENFVASNYSTIIKEATVGKGESIDGLAQVLGCDSSSDLGGLMKSNYNEIFSAPGAVAMLETLRDTISTNPLISNTCSSVVL